MKRKRLVHICWRLWCMEALFRPHFWLNLCLIGDQNRLNVHLIFQWNKVPNVGRPERRRVILWLPWGGGDKPVCTAGNLTHTVQPGSNAAECKTCRNLPIKPVASRSEELKIWLRDMGAFCSLQREQEHVLMSPASDARSAAFSSSW